MAASTRGPGAAQKCGVFKTVHRKFQPGGACGGFTGGSSYTSAVGGLTSIEYRNGSGLGRGGLTRFAEAFEVKCVKAIQGTLCELRGLDTSESTKPQVS